LSVDWNRVSAISNGFAAIAAVAMAIVAALFAPRINERLEQLDARSKEIEVALGTLELGVARPSLKLVLKPCEGCTSSRTFRVRVVNVGGVPARTDERRILISGAAGEVTSVPAIHDGPSLITDQGEDEGDNVMQFALDDDHVARLQQAGAALTICVGYTAAVPGDQKRYRSISTFVWDPNKKDTRLSREHEERSEGRCHFTVVTFNSGTNDRMPHDENLDDGYTSKEASRSRDFYGNGLAWPPAIEAAKAFFERLSPEIVAFQEIFGDDCARVPWQEREGFVCASQRKRRVAELVLGPGYQIACVKDSTDKCIAVRMDFGRFRGCDGPLCLEGLLGVSLDGCGKKRRVARGVIESTAGGVITVVNVHTRAGPDEAGVGCRIRQFEQIFLDLDGEPAANGHRTLVLGDFNADPGRLGDRSAARFVELAAAKGFRFLSTIDPGAAPTYRYAEKSIDHVLSDTFWGECTVPGVTPGTSEVFEGTYFDHRPIVCRVSDVHRVREAPHPY